MLFVTQNGAMKRVKTEEIQEGNRPVKGSLIAKKVKTNPQYIQYAEPIRGFGELKFTDQEDKKLRVAEVPLKSTDTTFSNPLELKSGWYIEKGIEECRIIDKPAEIQDEIHEDVEKISLFDGENE